MNTYRTELGDLRKHLTTEVDSLREQFTQLQRSIQAQLQETAKLADMEGSVTAKETNPTYKSHLSPAQ
jgi:hypothetical protein